MTAIRSTGYVELRPWCQNQVEYWLTTSVVRCHFTTSISFAMICQGAIERFTVLLPLRTAEPIFHA
ncbi:hypothetical protein FHW17_003394 [Phyllobacterium sp. P30BS-XVII]|nr:hypothetical protein [Phyllobacterium sp. P30BS-XVII]